jgi:hypothetical protein
LIAGLAIPGHAAAPKTVIEDPVGDANFVNDQGTGDGSFGDQTAADAGTVSDIEAVNLSNDAKNLYVDFVTEAAPPATTGIGYRFRANEGGCFKVEAYFSGANNVVTTPVGYLIDDCNGGEKVEIEIIGTRFVVPRSASPALKKGSTLTAPQAQAFLYWGDGSTGAPIGYADTTKVGTDWKLVDKKKK